MSPKPERKPKAKDKPEMEGAKPPSLPVTPDESTEPPLTEDKLNEIWDRLCLLPPKPATPNGSKKSE